MDAEKLAKKLKNIGPKTAKKLIAAGIDSPEKLKKLGAVESYFRLLKSGNFDGTFHAAFLYALEGAIENVDWREISAEKKREFRDLTAKFCGKK